MPRERTAPPTAWQVSVRCTFRFIHGASNTMNRPTIAKRRAQSARDKKKNKKRGNNSRNKTISAPLARSQVYQRPAATMRNRQDRLTLTHTELVATVTGGSAFSTSSYLINPGLPDMFPWGSQVSTAYDFYIPKTLTFSFKPVLPATESGMVFIYADSDTKDQAPHDFQQASGNAHFKSTSVWTPLSQTYPTSFFHTRRMFKIRKQAYPPETSGDDYDCARIWFGSEGISATKTLGYLSVSYTFELINPTVASAEISEVVVQLPNTFDTTFTGTVAENVPLTGAIVESIKGDVPVTLPEVGSAIDGALTFARPFIGTVASSLLNLHHPEAVNRTMAHQGALAFQHFISGTTASKAIYNDAQFIEDGGWYSNVNACDDFYLEAAPGATLQPALKDDVRYNYSTGNYNRLKYVFNAARSLSDTFLT